MKNNYTQSKNRLRYSFSKLILTSLFFLLIASTASVKGQASSYSFSESTETYAPITGTNSTATGDDGVQDNIPIGFNFKFEGVTVSSFSISTNGFIRLNTAVGTTHWTNSLANAAAQRPLIAALWDDNHRNTGSIQYLTSGTAPNQVLEVMWNDVNLGGSGSISATNLASFLIRLHETTNVIEIVYGGTLGTAGTLSASVGLNGSSSFLSVTPGASSTVSSTTANNSISSTTNLVGTKYTFTPPACSGVIAIGASNITTSNAVISWTNGGTETSWEIEYGVAPFTFTGTATTAVTTNPTTLTGLSASTIYEYKIRAICGGPTSAWSSTQTFSTPCGTAITPMPTAQNFSTYLPLCWDEKTGTLAATSTLTGTTSSWQQDDYLNNAANGFSAKINIFGTALTGGWLISPSYDLGSSNDKQLIFKLGLTPWNGTGTATLGADDKFAVVISTDNGVTWSNANTLRLWNNTTPISNTGEDVIINLSTYTGVIKIGFYAESTVSNVDNDLFVDDFQIRNIPACPEVTSIFANAITNNSAIINWTNGGSETAWDIEYGIATYTFTGTPTLAVTSNPSTLTGLTSNTSYQYRIRSNCGGTQSTWSSTRSFATLCSIVSSYTENFDLVTAADLPSCFAKVGTTGSVNTQTGSNNTAPNCLYIYASGTTNRPVLALPPVNNAGAGTHQLKLMARANFTVGGKVEVGYLTNPTDANTFISVQTFTASTLTYQEYTFNLGTTPGANQVLALRHTGSPANSVLIDDLSWEPLPTCPKPFDLIANSITANSASLNWTNGGAETAWDVEYGISPYTFTGTPTTSTTVNPLSITSLTSNSTYEIRIRANCGGGDLSQWSNSISFTTPCSSFQTPTVLAEDFETYLPGCWTEANGTLAATSTLTGTTSNWTNGDYLNNVSNGQSANLNIYSTGLNAWLISPSYDLGTGGGKQLVFNLGLTVWNNTTAATLGTDDKFAVVVSTDNGVSWSNANILRSWNSSNTISNTGEEIAIDLSAYSGIVKFGFYGESTASNADNDLFIDNFEIITIPTCVKPSSISLTAITDNSATLNWTAPTSSTPTNYEWEVRSSGLPGSGATGLIANGSTIAPTVTANLTGLPSSTTLSVYVRSNCGSGDFSTWSSGTNFNTLCGIINTPTVVVENFDTFLPNCWEEATGTLAANSTLTMTDGNWGTSEYLNNISSSNGFSAYINIYGTSRSDWLISPSYDLGTSGNKALEFDLGLTEFNGTLSAPLGTDDKFAVIISTDNGATWASANTLRLWNSTTPISNLGEHISISLATYTGVVKFAFYGESTTSNEDNDLFVDNFNIFELSNDATLSSIIPSDIGTYTPILEPTFVSSITNYTVNLPFNPYNTLPGTPAEVTATATNSGASVVITNAVDATTGTAPDNVATIVVTSSDGTSVITYTVTYQVAPPSNDASLTSLVPSAGNLSPTFVSTNTSYDVTLILGSTGTAGVASFVTSNPYATVSVVDASDVTGTIPNANICVVTVTAEDGTTQQQYYINYYVATSLNSDANLSSITPSAGTLSPTFVSSITNYTVNLPVGTTGATTTTVVTNDFYATYTVTNATDVSGTSPANVATIVVTAQDGTMVTYTVTYNVIPPSSDATLLSLTTSQGTLEPAFSPGTLSYAVHLPEGSTGVGNITGVVNNAFAIITSDVDATNVAGAAPANTAQIVVTAQNGTTLTYIVVYDIITSIKNNNTDFASFSVVPNPTTGIATVNVLDKASKNITISVVSVSGQLISETKINTNGLEVNSTIDLSNQPKGVYFVKVVGEKSIQTKRVITY